MNIDSLLNAMTLDKKILLLTGAASMDTAAIERLNIPSKHFADGPHGVRATLADNCTMFPNLCCVGATWDKALVHKMGQALADDCIEHGVDMLLGPGINLKRTPLCGRNFEYFSEDPVVSGELAAAYIGGLQSKGVSACLKHYALNNQEKYRLDTSVEVDLRVMHELYLKGFEIAVKKSAPHSVMCAYNKVHSIWCAENRYLLTDVLKDRWGYEGMVVSDWGAVRDICRSLCAGLDLEMPRNPHILEEVSTGLEQGCITEEVIDRAVRTVLQFVLRPKPQADVPYCRQRQHAVAQEIAASGIVLLKNHHDVLPLTREKYRRIGVIGEFADKPLLFGQGSAEVYADPSYISSPLQELRKNLGDDVEVRYLEVFKRRELPGEMIWPHSGEWTTFAKDCDAIVIFAGCMESEDTEQFDRRTIEFNPNYEFVINAICKVNPNVIVVCQSGSAMVMGDWRHQVSGIVQMWLGGEGAGKAIADILTGAVNPSGKLTETFPIRLRTDMEYPGDGRKVRYNEGMQIGYRYYDLHPDEVCYPFGYGLSYTQFALSDFMVKTAEDSIHVSLSVTNTGKYDGQEVIQVYVGKPDSCVSRPVKELKAFEKVHVPHGASSTLSIAIPLHDLAYYNLLLNQWVIEPGAYDIHIATSACDVWHTECVHIHLPAPYTIISNAESMIG